MNGKIEENEYEVAALGVDDDAGENTRDTSLFKFLEDVFAPPRGELSDKNIRTVGKIENVLWRYFPDTSGERILYDIALEKLRFVLMQSRGELSSIAESDPISGFFTSPRKLKKALKSQTGLSFPLQETWWSAIGITLVLALVLLIFLFGDISGVIGYEHWLKFVTAMAILIAAWVLLSRDPGKFAPGQTVGDAARLVAWRNFGRLAREGGKASRDELWNALRAAIAHHRGLRPEQIGRNTRIYR